MRRQHLEATVEALGKDITRDQIQFAVAEIVDNVRRDRQLQFT